MHLTLEVLAVQSLHHAKALSEWPGACLSQSTAYALQRIREGMEDILQAWPGIKSVCEK